MPIRLYKNGVSTPTDGDWYLRSSDDQSRSSCCPDQPLYPARRAALRGLCRRAAELERARHAAAADRQQLMGRRRHAARRRFAEGRAPATAGRIWGRIEEGHAEFDPETSTSSTDYDVTTWKLQAGSMPCSTRATQATLIGGLTVHYGNRFVRHLVDLRHGLDRRDRLRLGRHAHLVRRQRLLCRCPGAGDLVSTATSTRRRSARRLPTAMTASAMRLSIEAGQKFALRQQLVTDAAGAARLLFGRLRRLRRSVRRAGVAR